MTDNLSDLSTSIPSGVEFRPWRRSKAPAIETCHIHEAHEHTEEERSELRAASARWGARTVDAYIELHEQPSARGRYTRIRRRRPPSSDLQNYALSVAWAGPAKTDDDINAERASAEKRYEAEELRTAAELGISLAALRRRHWSEAGHLSEGGTRRLRRDFAWLRADVASPRHRMDIISLFPDGADVSLENFRFNAMPCQGEEESRAKGERNRTKTRLSDYQRFPRTNGNAS